MLRLQICSISSKSSPTLGSTVGSVPHSRIVPGGSLRSRNGVMEIAFQIDLFVPNCTFWTHMDSHPLRSDLFPRGPRESQSDCAGSDLDGLSVPGNPIKSHYASKMCGWKCGWKNPFCGRINACGWNAWMPLSDSKISALVPSDRQYRVADGDGLCVVVKPLSKGGGKSLAFALLQMRALDSPAAA